MATTDKTQPSSWPIQPVDPNTNPDGRRKVPKESAFFLDGYLESAAGGSPSLGGSGISRTWLVFFEYLASLVSSSTPAGPTGASGPFQRTLLLKDTTVGDNIADHVTVYGAATGKSSKCILVTGVLRKVITSDLTVRINVTNSGGTTAVVGSFTIPHATAVNTTLSFTTFATSVFPDKGVFSWDVLASDGQQDAAGVASYTVEWQP